MKLFPPRCNLLTVQAGLGPRTPMAYQSLAAPQSRSEKESPDLPPHQQMGVLTFQEKKFLLAVERGDVASSRRLVKAETFQNINQLY